MATIRAAFFDIDGTLVPFLSDGAPASTLAALRALREKGVLVFVASGRPPRHLDFVHTQVPVPFDGYVLMNGQYCIDAGGRVLRSKALPRESFRTLLPYLEASGASSSFVELDYIYTNRISEALRKNYEKLGPKVKPDPIDDPARALTHDTYQLSAYISEEEEAEFLRHLPGCKAARWSPDFTDIIPEDGGKAVGVQAMLQHFGLTMDQAIAFGDGGNDMDMLRAVGIGVAMGNAGPQVKAAADYVTTDVEQDGIANALRHFGLI